MFVAVPLVKKKWMHRTALLPDLPDGTPFSAAIDRKGETCVAWVPDQIVLAPKYTRVLEADARADIRARLPEVDLLAMEQADVKKAVLGGVDATIF